MSLLSTLSTSAMPLVTSGIAVTPPVPVKVPTPAPSRRIHASSVNLDAPSAGAGPSVTNASPLNRSPLFALAATVTVNVSVVVSCVSLALSCSTYDPSIANVAVVESAAALPNVTGPGPLTLLHCVVNVAVGRPSSDAWPDNVTVAVGSVIG